MELRRPFHPEGDAPFRAPRRPRLAHPRAVIALALALAGVGAAGLVAVFVVPAVWDATAGCKDKAEDEIRLIRTEVVSQVPREFRSRAYANSGCDSFDSASVSWRPRQHPERTLEVFARAGWTRMSSDALDGYGDGATGYSKRFSLGTIEVVYTQVNKASFQAVVT